MTQTVQDRVIAIIAEQAVLDVPMCSWSRRWPDLGIDSLGLVEAIFAIEEAFDISVPFNANEPAQIGRSTSPRSPRSSRRSRRWSPHRAAGRMKRVVITGAGTINALAHDVPGTLAALREGRCGIAELDIRDTDRLSIQIGGQVHRLGSRGALQPPADCSAMTNSPSSPCLPRARPWRNRG